MQTAQIGYVQIFGERCSGTNYLARLVAKNFRQVALTSDFGFKHWFIAGHEPRGRSNETTDLECIRSLDDSDDTLFLVIARNPFDWLRSLHAKPYHAPRHAGLSFSDFLRTPWISYENGPANVRWAKSRDGSYFIEEAKNVLSLRSLKLRHFNALQRIVPHVSYVRYEELRRDPQQLAAIGEIHGIESNEVIGDIDAYLGGAGNLKGSFNGGRSYPPISHEDLEFVRVNLDWDVEALFGYSFSDLAVE